MTKRNDSIKKVQSLDWDDSFDEKPMRQGYIVEKWFDFRQIQAKKKQQNSSKLETQ